MTPQKHRSKWTDEEDIFLYQAITKKQSLGEIQRTISLRTAKAIKKRANDLGYSNKYDKSTKRTYFYKGIKPKQRRTKEEIMGQGEHRPTNPTRAISADIDLAVNIVPKIEVDVTDLDKIIALHKELIVPHQTIIIQIEKIKSKSWGH